MAELDDIIHQPLRLKIMAALNALPAEVGLEFARLKKLTGDHRRPSRRPYRDPGEGGVCPGGQGFCGQVAADHGDSNGRGPRGVRPACGYVAGDYRGEAE